jgi:hypothetical protein
MIVKPFEPAPASRYCRCSNAMWDVIMPTCTPAEFMVLNFIFRQTAGFNKAEDQLSYNQIGEGTGIKGRITIRTALKGLLEKGYITQRGERRGLMWYGVNQDLEIDIEPSSEIELEPDEKEDSSSEIELGHTSSSSEIELEPDEKEDSSSEIELDDSNQKQPSSSKIELENANLVQFLNTPKDMSLKDIDSKLSNDNLVGKAEPPQFSEILALSIKKIKNLGLNLDAQDWRGLIDLETRGKNRQTLLEFFNSRINAPPAAVEVYRSVQNRYPPREMYDEIDTAVGDSEENLARWRQVIIDYRAVGWNPANVVNQLEFFKRGQSPRDATNGSTRVNRSERETTGTAAAGRDRYRSSPAKAPADGPCSIDPDTEDRLYDAFGG